MRIGLFSDTFPPHINGVATSVSTLKKALEKKGHQVYVVTASNSSFSYKLEDDNTVLRLPGIKTRLYDYRLSGIYPLKAKKIIKEWKLDIIHSHQEFAVGTFGRILAKQLRIPLVHTYHTQYEDYAYYVTKGHLEKVSTKIIKGATKFYCEKTADELIVPTKKIYDLFIEKYKFKKIINIVPTGIETERYYEENIDKKHLEKLRKEYKLKKSDFVVLFVGRIAAEKNIEFLLEAHKKMISKKVKFVVLGGGPDLNKHKNKYEKYKEHIIFAGKVPWEEVPIYYQLADLFATASTSETQGLTVIEAMAASVPPICIEDESFSIAVVSGLNGYFFKTEKEYIDRVLELKKHPKKRKRMAAQARANSEMHSSKHYAERILTVYNHALESYKKKKRKKINIFKRS